MGGNRRAGTVSSAEVGSCDVEGFVKVAFQAAPRDGEMWAKAHVSASRT